MDCERVRREDVAERYLAGRLEAAERDAFEEHYFACPDCTAALERVRALQLELAGASSRAALEHPRRAGRRRPAWALVAAAAVVVGAVGVGAWLGLQRRVEEAVAIPPGPARPSIPAPGLPPAAPAWAALAPITPAPYTEPRLRSAADVRTLAFRDAMQLYRRAEFADAIPRLRACVEVEPAAADRRFFLGVSLLLVGQDAEGMEQLRRVVALGDTPYREEAHLYLARALLRGGDVAGARMEVEAVVALQGDREAEARGLLKALRDLR
jgi:hypothetical protein